MISIAMCTYNGERFIEEQLESILNQTYKNFELIITDDGSIDDTKNIIKKYIKTDNRIKLYENKSNLGFVKNFEKAISLCTGEYIALADQDDIWKETKLEVFLNKIKDNVLIYSDATLINDNSKIIGKNLITPTNNLVRGKCNKAFLLTNCVSGNTLMFKEELIPYILPIPSTVSFHDVWIAFVASTYGSMTYIKDNMTYYRRYSEQITKSREKNYKNFFDRLEQKRELKLNGSKVAVKNLEAFLELKILKDKETIKLIKLLIKHYQDYEKIFFNFELNTLLKENKNEVFAIRKSNKRNKYLFRISTGLKFHNSTLFIV